VQMDSRSRSIGKGALEELMRERIRGTIETIVEEELEAALGAARSARAGTNRTGYRHGKRARTLRHQPRCDHHHDAARADRG